MYGELYKSDLEITKEPYTYRSSDDRRFAIVRLEASGCSLNGKVSNLTHHSKAKDHRQPETHTTCEQQHVNQQSDSAPRCHGHGDVCLRCAGNLTG